jgi:CubicO group peptidase (beta-lactamase class C family)
MLGEIMRRVTGKSLPAFVQQEIAGPLDADFLLGGLSSRDQLRCAEVLPNLDARLLAAKEAEKESLRARTMLQYPAEPWSIVLNCERQRTRYRPRHRTYLCCLCRRR